MKTYVFHSNRLVVLTALLVAFSFQAAFSADSGTDFKARARKPVPSQTARVQLTESLDAGDFYNTPQGPKRLRRAAGSVAVRSSTAKAASKQLTARGGALDGYVARKTVRDFAVHEATADRKHQELADPAVHRASLKQARSRARGALVNPVFIDPKSGLRLLATEEIIIALKPGIDAKTYFGRKWKDARPVWGAPDEFVLTLPGFTAEQVFAECSRRAQDKAVDWSEPNFIRQVVKTYTPNDEHFSQQWNLDNFGLFGGLPGADAKLKDAWEFTTGNPNVLIAILDDGVDIDHPDLYDAIYVNAGEVIDGRDNDQNGLVDDLYGYDFFANVANPTPNADEDNHGTAVAGIAAATGDNFDGIAGAGYGCQLLPVKIIEGDYVVEDATLARAIRYAAGLNASGNKVGRGADILNISLLFDPSSVVSSALNDAATKGRDGRGCVIMVAAGNFASAWTPYELDISTPGTYTLRWEYVKDGLYSDGDDTVWLDGVVYPDGSIESFEGGSLPEGWSTSAGAPWSVVQEGVNGNRALVGWDGPSARSLRAGAIGNNQLTYVQTTRFLTPGVFRFWLWVSSERNYDFSRFKVGTNIVNSFTESGVPIPEPLVAWPASHPACFAVGASTDLDYRSDYSQYGSMLDFLAPSDGGIATIFTTDRSGEAGYWTGDYSSDFGGTSASAPLASGVAGLILSMNPHLYAGDVRKLMHQTCDQIGGVTYDSEGRNYFYGSGRINAGSAVSQARIDLWVDVYATAGYGSVGGRTTYSITVRNNGSTWTGPFVLTNTLPEGTAFASSAPAPSTRTGGRLRFNDPGLEPGEYFTYEVTVTNLTAGLHTFTASAGSDVVEVSPSDNADSEGMAIFDTPAISIGDASGFERDFGNSNFVFLVTLSNPSTQVVSVNYATVTNTARAGADFTPRKGKLTFQPGQTTQTVAIRIVADRRNEADKDFFVRLSSPINATLDDDEGAGVIVDDDPLPGISINDLSLAEGNSGLRNAVLKVQLTAASGREVTMNYATASGTALAGTDFVPTNGTLRFAPGKTSQNITVKVIGDVLQQTNVTFTVLLSDPVNALLIDGEGAVTILNDDKTPKLFVSDVAVTEGDEGESSAVFRVRLQPASGLPVAVAFSTTNGTALAGVDYLATNGVIVIEAGQTNYSIPISVYGDLLNEANETFYLQLSSSTNALFGDSAGTATITNDDALPVLSFDPPTEFYSTNGGERWIQGSAFVEESESGFTNLNLNVTLSAPSGRTVSAKYAVGGGTARGGRDLATADYLHETASGTVTLAPGETNGIISIIVLSQQQVEGDETFGVSLSNPVNATLGRNGATGVIVGIFPEVLSLAPASSGLELLATASPEGLRISFIGAVNGVYRLERTAHLSGETTWQPVIGAEEVQGTGKVTHLIDADAVNQRQGFYRIVRIR